MFIFTSFFVFLFGLIIGSFLNVLILRHEKRSLSGRSECFFCSKKLRWFELIPIFSFIIQKAKCRHCKNSISWQYPIVEFVTGLVFVFIFFFLIRSYSVLEIYDILSLNFITSFLILIVVWGLLIAIFVYDLYHKIIPDQFVFPFILMSLIWLFHFVDSEKLFSFPNLWDLFMGLFLFLFFASLWYFSEGKWMGFGDAKLAIGMGFLLGFSKGLVAFMFSFWIGAFIAILFILINKMPLRMVDKYFPKNFKKITVKSEIPFAPFLIIGIALAFFFDLDFINTMIFLF